MHKIKKLHISPYELSLLAFVAGAVFLRFLLICANWPVTNSDEATMGLMARHIAYNGELPTFFYGQYYMGPMEAYIGAVLFHLFGSSTFTLRLGLILLFALFLVTLYYLTSLLYSKKFALAMVALFSLGSNDVILHQLKGIGGYPELVFLTALILLLVAHLSLSSSHETVTTGAGEQGLAPAREPNTRDTLARVTSQRWRRLLLYASLGVVMGFTLWTDQLILPILATSGLTLLLFCRRELFRWGGLSLLLGFIVGAFPMIRYNLTAPYGQTSFNALLDVQHSGTGQLAAMHLPLLHQLIGSLMVALPSITGANPICTPDPLPAFTASTLQTYTCIAGEGLWSLGFLLLSCFAALLAIPTLWTYWRQSRRATPQEAPETQTESTAGAVEQGLAAARDTSTRDTPVHNAPTREATAAVTREEAILQFNRLMLLAGALLTLAAYTVSAASALYPGETSRYLICVQVGLPAVLWPLWNGVKTLKLPWFGQSPARIKVFFLARVALLLLIATTFVVGTIRIIPAVADAQGFQKQGDSLVQHLESVGATHIYSDYWTCNRIIFQSNERIICAVLSDKLRTGQNRYAPYLTTVKADPHAAYAFAIQPITGASYVTGVVQNANFAGRILSHSHTQFKKYVFAGYVVYQPITATGSQ